MVSKAVLNLAKLMQRTIKSIRAATESELRKGRDVAALSLYIDLMAFGKACRCLLPEEEAVFRGMIEENIGDLVTLYRGDSPNEYKSALLAVITDCIINIQNDEPATPSLLCALEAIPGSPWYPAARLAKESETALFEADMNTLALRLILDHCFPEFPDKKSQQADWFEHIKFLLIHLPQLNPRLTYSILSHLVASSSVCSQVLQFRLSLHSYCRGPFSSSAAAGYFINDILSDIQLAIRAGSAEETWDLVKQIDMFLELVKLRENIPCIFEAMIQRVKGGLMAEFGRREFNSHKRAILHMFGDLPAACIYYEAIDDWIEDTGFFGTRE